MIYLPKTFYLIGKFWLGEFKGFIKVGDNKEEILKLFNERYSSCDFGVTEESFKLYKVEEVEEVSNKC